MEIGSYPLNESWWKRLCRAGLLLLVLFIFLSTTKADDCYTNKFQFILCLNEILEIRHISERFITENVYIHVKQNQIPRQRKKIPFKIKKHFRNRRNDLRLPLLVFLFLFFVLVRFHEHVGVCFTHRWFRCYIMLYYSSVCFHVYTYLRRSAWKPE